MSDNRPQPPVKKPPEPETDWLEDLRDRLADWIDTLLHPPVPVPVPVRRHR